PPPLSLLSGSASDHTSASLCFRLSLHDALPIFDHRPRDHGHTVVRSAVLRTQAVGQSQVRHQEGRPAMSEVLKCRMRCAVYTRKDRKSTRLNSSHVKISYAVLCLKKNKERYLDA